LDCVLAAFVTKAGPTPANRGPALAECRGGSERRDQLPSALDGEQRGPDGNAADEVMRAVDRIDDPARLAVSRLRPELFAQQAVMRELGGNTVPQPGLDLGVSLG